MPKVVAMLKEKRERGEGEHLDACWKHGVVLGEPGWFFASEAGVHIGTLWPEAMQSLIDLRAQAEAILASGKALGLREDALNVALTPLLILKPAEAAHGQD